MKLKAKTARRGAKLAGSIRCDEGFLYAEAECARGGSIETLLPFSYAQTRKGFDLVYHTGSSQPLSKILKDPLPVEHFESMLISFRDMARACDENELALQRVSFKEETLFYDPARFILRFAYLPAAIPSDSTIGPLHALERLVERAWLSDERSRSFKAAALDHIRRSVLFSWMDFERFLGEQGVLQEDGCDQPKQAFVRQSPHPPADRVGRYGYDFISAAASCAQKPHGAPESGFDPCYNPFARI